jgi:hypothetical protein
MTQGNTHALNDVLDRLEGALEGEKVRIGEVVGAIGHSSFASLMLIFALICTSPASAIPGLTTVTALVFFTLTVQLITGRDSVWMPDFIMRHRMSTKTIGKGIAWLRKPVGFVEKFLKARLTFVFHRPWLWAPLILILCLTLFMPFMEIIPAPGSVASAVIALFAAGLLTRDGVLALISLIALLAVPVVVWQVGFA